MGALEAVQNSKTYLNYDIREYSTYNALIELTPTNCFVGRHEVIPGLESDYFPLPRSSIA
jgi:hypothetical protein